MTEYKKGIIIMLACAAALNVGGCEELSGYSGLSDFVNEMEELWQGTETTEFSVEDSAEAETQEETPQENAKWQEEAAPQGIYYAYNTLSVEEQGIYMEMLNELKAVSGGVALSTLDVSGLDRIFACVMSDHPELFYVDGFKYTEHFFGGALIEITFEGDYSMSGKEAELAYAEIEESLSECMENAPSDGDEYNTVKYLYEYLIDNTEYDKDAENNQNIRSVFLGGRSVCQGYAKAMQYMLQRLGIQAVLVTGYTGEERHAWDLVCVNGSYYYLDPTWGDASYSYGGEGASESAAFFPTVNYDYFLVTTEEIAKTHSFEETMELPVCSSVADNYYVREGLYFTSYDIEQLEEAFARASGAGAEYVTLKCADSRVYMEMLSKLVDERQIFEVIADGGSSISYASNDELCTISFWGF